MNKVLSLTFALVITFTLVVCGGNSVNNINEGDTMSTISMNNQVDTTAKSNNENSQESTIKDIRIKLTFNNEEVIVKMYDNPTSKDFLTLLPLTLKFEDYAGTEKISYLPRKLSTKDAPAGSDPDLGDLTLYAPWGNLAIFYKDFAYANGLIKLGKIESGIEKLAEIKGDFTVEIDKMKM